MPSDEGHHDVELKIALRESENGPDSEFVLLGANGDVVPGSTLPDPRAALAAVERFGEEMFFLVPRPDRICTQQYGGPQVAVVTGWFHGREVASRFSRTDGCEIARWKAMSALLGGVEGSTGAI